MALIGLHAVQTSQTCLLRAISALLHLAGHVLQRHMGAVCVRVCQLVVVRGKHAPADILLLL